jgi:hypothetical protein
MKFIIFVTQLTPHSSNLFTLKGNTQMTVLALEPKFTDRKGYNAWRAEWKILYKEISKNIRKEKLDTKNAQKAGLDNASSMQSNLTYSRAIAFKAMSLLTEAKLRMKRLYAMEKQLKEQMDKFPLSIAHCKIIDFHFNKGHLEFSQLPMWILKTAGQMYYINHFEADGVSWSTRELPDGKTKGMLRFKNCALYIDKDGNASVGTAQKEKPETLPIPEEKQELDNAA